TGVPSPQSTASVNPAAMSAAEGSVVVKVRIAGVPATIPGGTEVAPIVGATLVTVTVALSVATAEPSVTRTETVWVDGPSPSPRASRWAWVGGGVARVASSNCPSASTSQAKVAPAPADDPVASRVRDPPSATVYGPPASADVTVTVVVTGALVPPSLSVAVA